MFAREFRFIRPDFNSLQTLQTRNVKLSNANGITNVTAPNATAGTVKIDDAELNGVDGKWM